MSKIALDFFIRVLQILLRDFRKNVGVRQLAAAFYFRFTFIVAAQGLFTPNLGRKEIPFLEFVLTLKTL